MAETSILAFQIAEIFSAIVIISGVTISLCAAVLTIRTLLKK